MIEELDVAARCASVRRSQRTPASRSITVARRRALDTAGRLGGGRRACRRILARHAHARRGGPPARAGAKHVVERDAELADHRVERADRRLDLARLDLRDEARRDVEPARELPQAEPALRALLPQPLTESSACAPFARRVSVLRRTRSDCRASNSGRSSAARGTAPRAPPARCASSSASTSSDRRRPARSRRRRYARRGRAAATFSGSRSRQLLELAVAAGTCRGRSASGRRSGR